MKRVDLKQKEKKSWVDIANTGLGAVKTIGGIASDASSLFGGDDGGIVESAAWRRANLGVDTKLPDYSNALYRGTRRR